MLKRLLNLRYLLWPWETLASFQEQLESATLELANLRLELYKKSNAIIAMAKDNVWLQQELARVQPYDSVHFANWIQRAQQNWSAIPFTEDETQFMRREYEQCHGWDEALQRLRTYKGSYNPVSTGGCNNLPLDPLHESM